MKPIKQTLMSGAMILAVGLAFTSCDDILGEWSRPAPNPVTPAASKTAGTISYAESSIQKTSHDQDLTFTNPLTLMGDGVVSYESSNTAVASVDATGKVTIVGAGNTTIKAKVADSDTYTYATNEASYTLEVIDGYRFLKWDDATKQLVADIETNYQEITSSTTTWDGSKVLVVKDADVSITTNITLSGNTTIILCDGAKLTTRSINGFSKALTIYGQSAQTGKLIAQAPAVESGISSVSELNIHGGEIEAIGSSDNYGIIIAGGTINVYGGKLTARGGYAGILNNGSVSANINVLGGMLEAYGGNFGGAWYGIDLLGTSSSITVSNHGKLKVQGGNGDTASSPADAGIYIGGSLVAKDYAEVTVTGGTSTSNAGGTGIDASVQITITDDAKLTVTGGSGATAGGTGTKSLIFTVSGNAQVKVSGGNGATGGDGIQSTGTSGLIIVGGNVEISGGNATGTTGNGGNAAFSHVAYDGGKFSLAGGAGSTSDSNGKAMKLEGGGKQLANGSGADATFQYSTDGSAWTDFTVSGTSPGNYDDSEKVRNRYLRTK